MSKESENREKGDIFRAVFETGDGVTKLPSGVLYQVEEQGEGAIPNAGNRVEVHYRGENIEGVEFDSSWARGEPARFGVTQVIAGWQEVLQMMPIGSSWKVVIPPESAYGSHGAGHLIGPGETLVFTISLLDVVE